MLAFKRKPTVKDYASDRVFDGKRVISPARLAQLRANYNRKHTTAVTRFVARFGEVIRIGLAHARH